MLKRNLIAAIIAGLLAVPAVPQAASEPRPSGKLLVNRYLGRSRGTDIFLISPRTGRERRLTNNDASQGASSFSPDGTRISFFRRNERFSRPALYVMDRDGSNVRKLAEDAFAGGEWSPDGRYLVYLTSPDGCRGDCLISVGVVEVATGETRVLSEVDYVESHIEWSPDSRYVVFSQRVADEGNADIYRAAVDGSSLDRLTDSFAEDGWPTYSPDGSRIVFESTRPAGRDNSDLFVMQADGSDETRVTRTSESFDQEPSWSPTSESHVVFSRRYGIDVRTGDNSDVDVFLLNVDTGKRRALTRDRRAADTSPLWSPDGRWVAFDRVRPDNDQEVYVVHRSGKHLTRVTANRTHEDYVAEWRMP